MVQFNQLHVTWTDHNSPSEIKEDDLIKSIENEVNHK